MSQLILIKAGQTEWQAQGRLVGDADLRLNEAGHRQAAAFAALLMDAKPSLVHCGKDEPSRETAEIIANELNLKVKSSDALREMDLGHWEGLTIEQFRERFAKVYKQWRNDPLAVEPPQGESVAAVLERMKKAIARIVKKGGERPIALVVGGYAYAALRCDLLDTRFEQFWEYLETDQAPQPIDYPTIEARLDA
ncbi:MAG TPA: histidine phosphatase family protein [Phycisphaerae bacterium]|nr:histidine phosphatase family protein [Phycisphaerae bacterium]HRW54156.1 histidine phosphatase family protein [Phycisphaerae bacterium]